MVGILSPSVGFGEQGDKDPQGPDVDHVPVTSVVRGAPVNLAATITTEPGSVLTSKVVLVRITDAGTPTSHGMSGSEKDHIYQAVLPVSLLKNINVFWYAIDARDDQGRIGGTIWNRVVIIDPVTGSGAAGAALLGGEGGAGAGAGGGIGKAGYIVGGLLLAGGAAVVIENNNDDSDKDDPPVVEPPEETGGKDDDDNEEEDDVPPPCNGVTGSETVTYENLSLCGSFNRGKFPSDSIMILVCYTCPNATIRATGSWEASDEIVGFNNPTCSPTAQTLQLAKPDGFPTPGTETINVFANGILIDSIVWPPLSDFDCF